MITAFSGAAALAAQESPVWQTTISESEGICVAGACTISTSNPAFFAFLIKPFLTIKLDPAPASHARHIFLTSDACIELIFPPKKIDSGVLPPKSIITY